MSENRKETTNQGRHSFFNAVTRVIIFLPRDVSACRLRDNPAQFRHRDRRVFLEVVSDEVFDERGRRCQLEPRAGVRDVEDETEDAVFSRTEPHLERTAVVRAANVKSLGVAPGDSVGLLVLQRLCTDKLCDVILGGEPGVNRFHCI